MEHVGQNILIQMKQIAPVYLMSWGSHAYKTFKDNQLPTLNPHMGGLIFRVNGRKHKGNVIVSLQPNDLYHIYLGQLRKGEMKIKQEIGDVYVEDLMTTLDELVET